MKGDFENSNIFECFESLGKPIAVEITGSCEFFFFTLGSFRSWYRQGQIASKWSNKLFIIENSANINRYRRGLETCAQAKTSKSGHAIFFFFSDTSERRVWLNAESKIFASAFWRFRLYRLMLEKCCRNFLGCYQNLPPHEPIFRISEFDLMFVKDVSLHFGEVDFGRGYAFSCRRNRFTPESKMVSFINKLISLIKTIGNTGFWKIPLQ